MRYHTGVRIGFDDSFIQLSKSSDDIYLYPLSMKIQKTSTGVTNSVNDWQLLKGETIKVRQNVRYKAIKVHAYECADLASSTLQSLLFLGKK